MLLLARDKSEFFIFSSRFMYLSEPAFLNIYAYSCARPWRVLPKAEINASPVFSFFSPLHLPFFSHISPRPSRYPLDRKIVFQARTGFGDLGSGFQRCLRPVIGRRIGYTHVPAGSSRFFPFFFFFALLCKASSWMKDEVPFYEDYSKPGASLSFFFFNHLWAKSSR